MRSASQAAAAVAALLTLTLLGCSRPEPAPRNLLLVSLDTTRPDHLSAYGYPRQTSPNFDRLAAGGALFANAFAQWTATGPSHATMLTGLYPPTHGFGVTRPRLRKRFRTLPAILRDAGFRTGAFVSGFTLKGSLAKGLGHGFDVWDATFEGVRRDGVETMEAALEWLDSGDQDRPYFVFLHLYDAHGPYAQEAALPRLFESADRGAPLRQIPRDQNLRDADGRLYRYLNDYVDYYDSGLVHQDEVLGRMIEAIDLENTTVIVVADHGESMGEHGGSINLTHATAVFDDQTRIPFLIRSPGLAPALFDEIVETTEILPTALELLGIPLPASLQPAGESLVPLLRGERAQDAGRLAFSGTWAKRKQGIAAAHIFGRPPVIALDPQRVVFAARSMRWKLVVYPALDGDLVALYDLESDPLETTDVGDDYPEIRDRLLQRSGLWLSGAEEPVEELELTSEEIEKLRALGYVD